MTTLVLTPDTDTWTLVAAAQRGDREAFGLIYSRHVDAISRFVRARVNGDRHLAEDITSETFMRALRAISSVSDKGYSIQSWLITIARNLLLDHFKSGRHRFEIVGAEAPSRITGDLGPEERAMRSWSVGELMRCVAQLSEDQRRCIVARFVRGLSIAETAAEMGRQDSAVKALQYRAVRNLAALLDGSAEIGCSA